MSAISFQRFSDRFPPERELLEIDADGTFTMWRSYGGGRAGRFAGTVTDPERVSGLVAAVTGATPPEAAEAELDASVEVLRAGDTTIEVDADRRVDGPWGDALTFCREQMRTLTSEPVAAIEGELRPDGVMRLSHVGTEALPLELAHLNVHVVSWLDGLERASSRTKPEGLGPVDAGPGWTLDVDVDPDVLNDGKIVATATFVAVDDGIFVPVVVTARSA